MSTVGPSQITASGMMRWCATSMCTADLAYIWKGSAFANLNDLPNLLSFKGGECMERCGAARKFAMFYPSVHMMEAIALHVLVR